MSKYIFEFHSKGVTLTITGYQNAARRLLSLSVTAPQQELEERAFGDWEIFDWLIGREAWVGNEWMQFRIPKTPIPFEVFFPSRIPKTSSFLPFKTATNSLYTYENCLRTCISENFWITKFVAWLTRQKRLRSHVIQTLRHFQFESLLTLFRIGYFSDVVALRTPPFHIAKYRISWNDILEGHAGLQFGCATWKNHTSAIHTPSIAGAKISDLIIILNGHQWSAASIRFWKYEWNTSGFIDTLYVPNALRRVADKRTPFWIECCLRRFSVWSIILNPWAPFAVIPLWWINAFIGHS